MKTLSIKHAYTAKTVLFLTCKRHYNNDVSCFQSKQWCKDQESIQSSTTPDPGYQWESDKLTEDTTNESQEVSPFPAGDHKAHINRRAQNIANTSQNKNIKDPQTFATYAQWRRPLSFFQNGQFDQAAKQETL